MTPHRFVDVALPRSIDQPFTYTVPPSLAARVALGMRAVVPFQKRVETGYVVGLKESSDVKETLAIVDLPDEFPVFTHEMIELCRWISQYYCCALGEALQCAVPAGIQIRTRMRYTLVQEQLGSGNYTQRQQKVIAALYKRGPLTETQLTKDAGRGALGSTLLSLINRGVLLAEPLAVSQGVSMRTETWVTLVENAVLSSEGQAAIQRRAPKQAAVYLDLLHGEPERAAAALYEKHGANRAVLRALENKALIETEEREFYRSHGFEADQNARDKHHLNEEQQQAYDAIVAAGSANAFSTFLLQGITGSGKTEVYLQAIEHILEQGRDAIILVPEISLTPQTVGRFLARFDTRIAVLHSGLGQGERYDEWRRAQRGEVRIVVGARSAIFAPLPNLGIVIVDEEHDTSYKQGNVPRYHARDVAIMRAQMNNAVCVLGSATPSIESYFNSERTKSQRLELKQRATKAFLPEVRLVDMREETKELKGEVVLSRTLEEEIAKRVDANEQVILLLNRRGHSPFVLCPQCGWVASCDDCHVSLTFHAKGGYLSCHYCNARRAVPQVCGECHFNPLIYLGAGTQKIEDYIARAFPKARIQRMDRDTTAGKGGHAKILGRFAQGETDILIGTQMIAKGHDYPGVTLVGVVNADTGLALPDFRAAETAFQLLTQVAGRAGRGDKQGEVIIQTYRPRHYAVKAAAGHDYAAFYQHEIGQREAAGYPPFRRLVNLSVEGEDAQEVERAIGLLFRTSREQVETLGFQGVQLLGPAPATIHRVKKKYRWNLGAFSKSGQRLNVLTRAIRTEFAPQTSSKIALKIDFDPYGMF